MTKNAISLQNPPCLPSSASSAVTALRFCYSALAAPHFLRLSPLPFFQRNHKKRDGSRGDAGDPRRLAKRHRPHLLEFLPHLGTKAGHFVIIQFGPLEKLFKGSLARERC